MVTWAEAREQIDAKRAKRKPRPKTTHKSDQRVQIPGNIKPIFSVETDGPTTWAIETGTRVAYRENGQLLFLPCTDERVINRWRATLRFTETETD